MPEARVLLLGGGSRGFGARRRRTAACSACSRRSTSRSARWTTWGGWGSGEVDLVIATGEVPEELEAWVRDGRAPDHRQLHRAAVRRWRRTVKLWKDPDGAYFRIRDKAMFPSLKSTDVTFMYGDYLEVEGKGPLTFIPPSMYGPPELVHVDWKDTEAPGLVVKEFGKGKVAWLPWNLAELVLPAQLGSPRRADARPHRPPCFPRAAAADERAPAGGHHADAAGRSPPGPFGESLRALADGVLRLRFRCGISGCR